MEEGDDAASLLVEYTPEYRPENRRYLIVDIVLLLLITLATCYLLFKTFGRSPRQAELKHARLLLMITAPMLTIAAALDVVSIGFTFTISDTLKNDAQATSLPHLVTVAFHTSQVAALFWSLAEASIIVLVPSVSLGLVTAAGAASPTLKKMRLAGYIVGGCLTILAVTALVMTEVLVHRHIISFVYGYIALTTHLDGIARAQTYLSFVAFTVLIPAAAFGRELAAPAHRKAGTLTFVASVCAFVSGLFVLIYRAVSDRYGWMGYLPQWVRSIMYRIFYDAMQLVTFILLATVIRTRHTGGSVGKTEI